MKNEEVFSIKDNFLERIEIENLNQEDKNNSSFHSNWFYTNEKNLFKN